MTSVYYKFYDDGSLQSLEFKNICGYHRDDGPSAQYWYENGQLFYQEYYINGKLHRVDGPAYQYWYSNGQLQCQYYFINCQKHRVDGPARQNWYENGQLEYQIYYINGQLHRDNGPADQFWYRNGQLCYQQYYINSTQYPVNHIYRLKLKFTILIKSFLHWLHTKNMEKACKEHIAMQEYILRPGGAFFNKMMSYFDHNKYNDFDPDISSINFDL